MLRVSQNCHYCAWAIRVDQITVSEYTLRSHDMLQYLSDFRAVRDWHMEYRECTIISLYKLLSDKSYSTFSLNVS